MIGKDTIIIVLYIYNYSVKSVTLKIVIIFKQINGFLQ